MPRRAVVVAIPARDEADRILVCLQHISRLETDARVTKLSVLVLANNCNDDTAERARAFSETGEVCVDVEEVALEPGRANAGWARRLSLEAGASRLTRSEDLLMCTDADTLVAKDWLIRTLDHLDAGYDAVAGLARLNPSELRRLSGDHRRRLAAIRRYEDARTRLEGLRPGPEPYPRHFYEGGASIALTLQAFDGLGEIPTPPVGEDRALFDALRAHGRRIRHPTDVKVSTSCRLEGRAPSGTADTLARWMTLGDHEDLGLPMLIQSPGGAKSGATLTWSNLERETQRARALLGAWRSDQGLAKAS